MTTISKSKNSRLFYLTFFVLIAIALLVRIHDFGKYPADINCDEAMAAVEAMALIENGTDQYGTSYPVYFEAWGHGQMNALLIYLLTIVIKMFGVSNTIVRIPMLIFSLAGIVSVIWIAWMLFSKESALFVLAFSTINPWHIMVSRWTLESNLFPHCLVIGLAFLIYSIKTGKKAFLYISMLIYGISLYAYGVAYSFIPVFLSLTFIFLYKTKVFKLPVLIKAGLCFFMIAWPIVTMMIINFFHLPSLNIGPISIQLFEKSTRTGDLLFSSNNIPVQLTKNLLHFIDIVILQKMDLWWNQLPKIGTMYKITIPFFLIGLVFLIQQIKRDRRNDSWNYKTTGSCILLFHLFSSFISGLIINNVNVNRINSIFYPLIIISAFGIFQIYNKKQVWGILIAFCYGLYFSFFCYRYFYSDDRYFLNYTFDKGFENAITQTTKFPSAQICISVHLYRPDKQIAETYTRYYLRLPYKYYSGLMNADELYESGFLLAYNEKYHFFENFEETLSAYGDNCIYIINVRDRDFFDHELFQVNSWDFFSIAIPKILQTN